MIAPLLAQLALALDRKNTRARRASNESAGGRAAIHLHFRTKKMGVRAIAAGLLLAASFATLAQTPGGSDARRGGPASSAMRPATPSGSERAATPNLEELVQMRLSQLEEDFNLKPEQRPLWNTYRERVLRLLDDTRRAARSITASYEDATAPKRLDALGDVARNRLTAVEDIVDAGKAFYASLTPAQQAIADRRLALPLATLSGSDAGAADARRPPAGGAGGESTGTPGKRP